MIFEISFIIVKFHFLKIEISKMSLDKSQSFSSRISVSRFIFAKKYIACWLHLFLTLLIPRKLAGSLENTGNQ
jgi:hypothetical protein